MVFKIFDLYDVEEVKVSDQALAPYINLEPKLLVKSHGRNVGKFTQSKVHIIERLANRLAVPGHVGKKHKIITSQSTGKYTTNMATVLRALKIIAEKKKVNPLQILVQAIENGSPRDEITTIEYGGARYPQAVDVSPLRRVNLAIRWMVQGSHQKSFGKKKKIAETLSTEIMNAADMNMESYSLSKKNEAEKQADSAR
ncbi:30S ribosomal protein S7 [Candidatus Pacearchaeota archaeon]|nr:30S ribosomal protein S7 [Candidatus Pacearchaeota archaeon]